MGSLIFTICVNSIKNCLNTTKLILYADDAVMYNVGSTAVELQSSLQSDLDNMSSWYGMDKLVLNTRKCKSGK